LKRIGNQKINGDVSSPPARGRGLKPDHPRIGLADHGSPPARGRGLKQRTTAEIKGGQ